MNVFFKNPRGIEPAINLSAMFIHFHKHSKFIIKYINKEIESIEKLQENNLNRNLGNHYDPKLKLVSESLEV